MRNGAAAVAWRAATLSRRIVASLAEQARSERSRWSLWLPVALGAGVGVYFALPFEPAVGTACASATVAGILGFIASKSNISWARAIAALACVALIGFTMAKLREEIVAGRVLAERIGPFPVEGRVDYAQAHGKGIRVILSEVRSPRLDEDSTPGRIRISFRSGANGLRPGDFIRATAVLMPPSGPAAPDAYDFARTAFFQRIGAVGYAYGRPLVVERAPTSPLLTPIGEWIARLRFRMTERIHDILPGSTGAIAAALITGDRGGISDQDESSLRDAGLAHVLAIAGLHMALVGLGIFWLVRAVLALFPSLALRFPIKKWAACAALGAAGFYLVISGAGAPSMRAFTMLAMMLLAVLVDRPALSMRAVALAAAIILLIEPESLVEPGFQMSFSAVVGLIAVAEWERRRITSERIVSGNALFGGLRRYARGIATTSLVGSIATMPFAIFHFDRATHYAVLGNLLAMPVMGFVTMPAAALSVAAMPFGLDAWPLRLAGLGISLMLALGHWVSTLPGSVSVVAAWPIEALVLISLGGLWCALWRNSWRWFGLVPVVLGMIIAFVAQPPDLLIAADGRTMAVRGSDGALEMIGFARDVYSANEWLKRDGDERTADEAVASSVDGTRCDALGCRARVRGMAIAKVLRADALNEDCARSDVLVSAFPLDQPCLGPKLVLDLRRIASGGGYAVWFSPLTVRSVLGARGERPWSTPPSGSSEDQN